MDPKQSRGVPRSNRAYLQLPTLIRKKREGVDNLSPLSLLPVWMERLQFRGDQIMLLLTFYMDALHYRSYKAASARRGMFRDNDKSSTESSGQ